MCIKRIEVASDVTWTVCQDCPLQKVNNLPVEVDTTRSCDREDQKNCQRLTASIVVVNPSKDTNVHVDRLQSLYQLKLPWNFE
jgi:hypothetical protein